MTTLVPPMDCHSMPELRAEIDKVDRELIALLAVRTGYIDRAVEIKGPSGMPARIPERVEDVVAKVRAEAVEKGLDPELVDELWRRLIDWSIAREAKIIDLD